MPGTHKPTIAYTSRRPFKDGRVEEPFPENDPANIAYVLQGYYYSFFSLKKLTPNQLQRALSGYDLIFVPLDHREFDTVSKIASACEGRLATYSEGNIHDYQMHPPYIQVKFLEIINRANINFLYWEKYLPFYRTLTDKPVEYLPYPYFYEQARAFFVPIEDRSACVTLPSGFAGNTRNGLGSLAVARRLYQEKLIERISCWVSTPFLAEEIDAIKNFLLGTPLPTPKKFWSWRKLLKKSGLDYRPLLKFKKSHLEPPQFSVSPSFQEAHVSIYRRRPWQIYLHEMAKTSLVVDMNNRNTVGRNALDCAAVGVPCVSTRRSDIQGRLFPDITVQDSWDVEEAVEFSKRLLADKEFYHSVIEKAWDVLPQFGEQAFLRRFQTVWQKNPGSSR